MPSQEPPCSSASISPGCSGVPRQCVSLMENWRCQPWAAPRQLLDVVEARIPDQRAIGEDPQRPGAVLRSRALGAQPEVVLFAEIGSAGWRPGIRHGPFAAARPVRR